MRSRFVRPAVAASACALLISASVGMSSAAFADPLIPLPLPSIGVDLGGDPIVDVTVGPTGEPAPTQTEQPQPSPAQPAPTGTSESQAPTGAGNETTGTGSSGAASGTTGTDAPATSGAAAASTPKSAAAAKPGASTTARGVTPPVLGPSVDGTTLFSDDSSPLGILAGSSPARTVMSNAVGIAMLGGLGAVLLVVIGLRLAVLRRRSRA